MGFVHVWLLSAQRRHPAFHAETRARLEMSHRVSSSARSAREAMSAASWSMSRLSGRMMKRPLQMASRARYSSRRL